MEHNFKIVKVQWVDSSQHGGWLSLDDINKLTMNVNMVSFGFLVRETDEFVVVSANQGEHHFSSNTIIPKCSIIDIVDFDDLIKRKDNVVLQ